MQIQAKPVQTQADMQLVADIAAPIWHETYDVLLPAGQTDYMIEKFQSVSAIEEQTASMNYHYYLLYLEEKAAGFIALVPDHAQTGDLFLSKIYISKDCRGQGVMGYAVAFARTQAAAWKQNKIWLTVNKDNTHAQEVYRHYGFTVTDRKVADIGGGYVMDDNIMTMHLP